MIVLPKEKLKARIENPRFLILFGKPKSGKTTLASKLDNNLIVDLEGGSEFLEALAIQARSVNDLGEIANAIREEIKKEGGDKWEFLKSLDVLIDGRFILSQRDLSLSFRGSRNQRLLRLKNGEIVSIE